MEKVEIHNVSEFIDEISKQRTNSRKKVKFFYRGHSDCTWNLEPSIGRSRPESEELYLEKEDEEIKEVLKIYPKEFKEDSSLLEKLVRLQHFGLPTRLLDITSNPLVALYFACSSNEKKDGEVIYFQNHFKELNEKDSQIIACCALLPYKLSKKVESEIKSIYEEHHLHKLGKSDVQNAFKKIFREDEDKSDKYFLYNGFINNDRVRNQHGSFLVFTDKNISDCVKFRKNDCKLSYELGLKFLSCVSAHFTPISDISWAFLSITE